MTSTLRDRLAAVLGPGNNDTTAYHQADAVLDLLDHDAEWTYIRRDVYAFLQRRRERLDQLEHDLRLALLERTS